MKKRRSKKVSVMAATTTSKDWDFGPVAGKGGKTQNSLIGDTIFHREMKESGKN